MKMRNFYFRSKANRQKAPHGCLKKAKCSKNVSAEKSKLVEIVILMVVWTSLFYNISQCSRNVRNHGFPIMMVDECMGEIS